MKSLLTRPVYFLAWVSIDADALLLSCWKRREFLKCLHTEYVCVCVCVCVFGVFTAS